LQRDNKIYSFDTLIFLLLFGLLPIDMINGFLIRDVQLNTVITISQLYKIILLTLFFIRISNTEKIIVLSIFFLLLLPSFVQTVKSFNLKLIFVDAVKVTKYVASFMAFLYFRRIFINKGYLLTQVYRWILFSFIVLVINIFLKLLGVGFPMYSYGTFEIGSKGFFYAGNEVSAVLLILSSFLMFWYQLYNKKIFFLIISLLAIFTGLYITSKTAILATIFTFIYLFIFNPNGKRMSIKSAVYFLCTVLIILPFGIYFIIKYLKTSDVMLRASHFWEQLDIYTFIFSNRNIFLFDFIEIFKKEYNVIEMIIGVGQSTFERLNNNHIIELDFFDIYFAYGIIGILLFLFYIFFILIKSKLRSMNRDIFIFSLYTKYIAVFLILLSFFSGHIFNSGMASIYIGCVFSLMYYNAKYENKLS